ncbi:MAG: PIN domain-containing protein [Lachnospiraceae bacterium]|jgi:predicted nucleic acid-binding protein
MKVLIDANIIIDFATNREPFAEQAQKIFELVNNSEIEGFIAVHSIPNLFYILRKSMDSTSLRLFLLGLCNLLTVVCIDETMIISGLQNISFSDFEDCLQSECAEKAGAKYIITRNTKDFVYSSIPAITPNDFFNQL